MCSCKTNLALLLVASLPCSQALAQFDANIGVGAGAFQSGMGLTTSIIGAYEFGKSNKVNIGRVAYPVNAGLGYTITTPNFALSGIGVLLNYRYLNSQANIEGFTAEDGSSFRSLEWTYHLRDQTNLSARYNFNLSPKTTFFAGLGASYQRIRLNDLHFLEKGDGTEEEVGAKFEQLIGMPIRWSARGHAMGGLAEMGVSQAINERWSLSGQVTYAQYQSIKGLRGSGFTITQDMVDAELTEERRENPDATVDDLDLPPVGTFVGAQQTFSRTPRSLDLSLSIAYHF